MDAVAQEIAERVRASPLVRIVTHIDTDGITGGAIAPESQGRILMLNPHLEGAGSDVASGAGCAYAVAKALDPANKDLASVAIVGAVGDVQDQEFRRLSGYNREILQDGIDAGVLRAQID